MDGREQATTRSPEQVRIRLAIWAATLVIVELVLLLQWGSGAPVLVLPWYVPLIEGFSVLAASAVALLAWGRSRVLWSPPSFWLGIAFACYAVLGGFYLATSPGLLPDGRALISSLPNTPVWFATTRLTLLATLLLLAATLRWPRVGGAGRWGWSAWAASAVAAAFLFGTISILVETSLPALLREQHWTPLRVAWLALLLAAFAGGSALSARRASHGGDGFLADVAVAQLLLAFAIASALIGGERFDPWWYWARGLWALAFAVAIFGLLADYVALYRAALERSRQIEALRTLTDPYLSRAGIEPLLEHLLAKMTAVLGANAGAILLLEHGSNVLVLRKGCGLSESAAEGLRVRIGEDFSGLVAAQNRILTVRDVRDEEHLWSRYIRESGVRGLIGAPMSVRGELLGVVHVDFRQPRSFDPYEIRLLEVVAERAAQAICQTVLLERAEAERKRLQVLLETTPTGIMSFAFPGFRLELFNPEAQRVFEVPLQRGRPFNEQPAWHQIRMSDGSAQADKDDPACRAAAGETTAALERQIQQPSGRLIPLLVNSAPLRHDDGTVWGAVVTFQDIGRLREQERLRDEFISAASHELKTPLTTIKASAQLIRRLLGAGGSAQLGELLSIIDEDSNRLDARVREMITAMRLRGPAASLRTEVVEMTALVELVAQRFRARASGHPIAVRSEPRLCVLGELRLLAQAVETLIDNALESSPVGGEVVVCLEAVAGRVRLSVHDQGPGIPVERLPYVFEPFFEAAPAGAVGYRGVVPLGIFVCRLIVESHGGRIQVESGDRGSTFSFDLPGAAGCAEHEQPRPSPA